MKPGIPASIETASLPPKVGRLVQIDALRAIAALSVVAFHYFTRYDQVFLHDPPLPADPAHGAIGVPLFFVISGFVIFMTLDRAKHPMDFVVSRASRLLPAYWIAVLLTFMAMQLEPLRGSVLTAWEGLVNLTMLQFFFSVRDVDGVYWSLQVELVFYVWMLLLWLTGLLRHAIVVCGIWVGVSLAAYLSHRLGGVDFPYVPGYFLLVDWIPWFAIGMVTYVSLAEGELGVMPAMVLTLALTAIAASKGARGFWLASGSGLAVSLASQQRLRLLEWRPLVFVGLASYPLYLVHQNIGYIVIGKLQHAGAALGWAIAIAIAVSIGIATTMHRLVEVPGARWLRDRYESRAEPRSFSMPAWTAGSLAALALLALMLRFSLRLG